MIYYSVESGFIKLIFVDVTQYGSIGGRKWLVCRRLIDDRLFIIPAEDFHMKIVEEHETSGIRRCATCHVAPESYRSKDMILDICSIHGRVLFWWIV